MADNIAAGTAHGRQIAGELRVHEWQANATIDMLDGGNTVPFIARYRKEATGGLDEVQIRTVQSRIEYLRNLDARKATVRAEIEDQGKLTPELAGSLAQAATLQVIEDLYRPYRPQRQTRASAACQGDWLRSPNSS